MSLLRIRNLIPVFDGVIRSLRTVRGLFRRLGFRKVNKTKMRLARRRSPIRHGCG
jgi:hypothetical protein